MCTMISRLSERIIRILPDNENEKKKKYLEEISQDNMTTKLIMVPPSLFSHPQMMIDMVDNFDNSKIPTIENILRTLNKLCYYSLPLCIEAFKAKMVLPLAKLINILEAQIGKGTHPFRAYKLLENQFSTLAYEVISLINAILALRAFPNPLVYNPPFPLIA
jgi:hypothetical protein